MKLRLMKHRRVMRMYCPRQYDNPRQTFLSFWGVVWRKHVYFGDWERARIKEARMLCKGDVK